jgi:hypothetical protein
MAKPDDVRLELLQAVREIIRDGVIVAAAQPDNVFPLLSQLKINVVNDVSEAYGYSTPWTRQSFSPRQIAQAQIVDSWLAWLGQVEGRHAINRIKSWANGAPLWILGQRERCTARTIDNRINRSVVKIITQFTGTDLPVEFVDEPFENTVHAMIWEHAPGPVTGKIELMKIYVGGRGFWRDGKYFNDGQWRIDQARKRGRAARARAQNN